MNEGFGDEHACLFDEPSRKSPEERIDPACEGVEARWPLQNGEAIREE